MADIDRYQPGGGGGRSHGGNRKRRYQDDGGDDHHRRGPPPQRRRFDPPGTRLRKKMLSLLDSSFHAPESEVAEIADLVVQHGGDEYVAETFVDLALSLALEQPAKTVFVAACVALVDKCAGAQRGVLVDALLQKTGKVLERGVRAGKWRQVKLGLRLLACLQGLLEGEGVLGLLEELFQRAVDLQHENPEETVGPELVKIILLTIPYLMISSAEGLQEKIEELLQKTDVVASTSHALEALVDPFSGEEEDRPMACPSLLSILQKQLQAEAENGWPLACMPKILTQDIALPSKKENGHANGDAAEDQQNEHDATMSESPKKHALPTVTIPETINPGETVLFPDIYYSVFADQDVESVPPTTNIASTIIRDAFVDTVDLLDYNRGFVGKSIIELDNFWAPNTFVKRATPFDKLKEVPDGKSTWKPEDMAIDAVFSQLMRLPSPVHKTVYYNSIIMEACKLAPSAIAPSLGRAIRFTFRSLAKLDLELVQRFTQWFAHHVSNFEFRWKWSEWIPDLQLHALHPRRTFIDSAIDKEIRLSFPKRIADSLPPDFAGLIDKGAYNDQPDYKYASESEPYALQGQAALAVIRDKSATDDALTPILNEVRELATGQGADPAIAAADVFMTGICHVGSKSLSHILSSIEKHRNRLLTIGAESEPARRQIISAVMTYWTHHPGQAVNIVDKLLNYTIVTPSSVVDWALTDQLQRGHALARATVLEMVWTTMGKVSRRVRDIALARANPDIIAAGDEQLRVIDETLVRERQGMRELFTRIVDTATSVAQGVQDDMHDLPDDAAEREMLVLWGGKWARLWTRRARVEELESGESRVPGLIGVLAEIKAVEAEVKLEDEEDARVRDEARRVREEERRRRWEEEREARNAAREERERGGAERRERSADRNVREVRDGRGLDEDGDEVR